MKDSKVKNSFFFKGLVVILFLSFGILLQAFPDAPGTAPAESREQDAEKYKWNPEAIYPTAASWKAEKEDIAGKLKKAASFKGKLAESADRLEDALSYIFDLYRKMDKLYLYAELLSDRDISQSEPLAMKQEMGKMYTEFASSISYIEPEILALPSSTIARFFKMRAGLKPYKRYIENILRMKRHTWGDSEENIIAQAGHITGIASDAHNVFSNVEIPFPEVTFSDGSREVMNVPGYARYRAVSNRDDRIKAYNGFYSTLGKFKGTLGVLLYGQIKENLFYTRVRKFDSILEHALYPKKIPTTVYINLIESIHKALPTLHRYLKIKKKMMGVKELHYHDLYPDLVKGADIRYSYEDACLIIQKALQVLGSEYTGKLKESFANRSIDVFPRPGKAAGAYSSGCYDTHSYIKINYNGKFNDISMLAHELGHATHSYFTNKNQPYPTANYASFIAEVAATVNEALVSDYVLSTIKNPQERLALLGSFMEACRMTLYRQTQFAEYELLINQMAEKGESLTGERFDQVYLDLLKKYYGHAEGVTVIDELYRHEWGYISHFYLGFYNYNYSTSFAAAHALAEKISVQGKPMVKKYIGFLSAGSTIDPIPLLQKVGVDMTGDEPIRLVVNKMNRVLDEIEKLIK
jgi:oligoendopeptidase F